MVDFIVYCIVFCFSFFVNVFVSVFNIIVLILTRFYKITEFYFFKKFVINLLFKTLLVPAFYKVIGLVSVVGYSLLIFPFVVLDNLLNVLSFLFFNTLFIFFDGLLMFFNLFTIYFVDCLSFFLLPEVLILSSAVLSLLIYVHARSFYTNERFFNELALAFGKEAVTSLTVGSYEYSVLLRFHNSKRRLTALFQAWWVSFGVMVFSFFWLMVSTYEVYAARLGYFGLELTSGIPGFSGSGDLFFGSSFYHDGFSQGGRTFILLISIIFMLLLRFEIQNDSKLRRIEFLFLFLVGSALSMLMISASSLLSLFLSVEGLVMVMYVLTAGSSIQSGFPIVKILRFRAVEGALKYAITNAVATGFFLLGAVLIFFFTGGELYFLNIFKTLKALDFAGLTGYSGVLSYFVAYYGLLLGVVLISLTFLFKMGAVPFHNWMADLYEASVPGVLTFFLLVPKAAILLTFLNLYRFLFAPFSDFFIFIFFFVGLLSAVVGSVHALYQLKIERLLAYSSVAHAGGFLLLLSAVSFSVDRPFHLVIFFVVAYIFVNALFLSVYLSLRYTASFFSHSYIKSFKLFSNLTPSAQKVVSTIFFNLAGLPPFLGWFLKALVLIVWVKACFFVRSNDLFIGSGLESLFDFNSVLSGSAGVGFFLLSNFQESFVVSISSIISVLLNWIGYSISGLDSLILNFSRKLVFSFFVLLIIFIFLIMAVSTFYYVRLISAVYGTATNTPVVLDKQGLLNPMSLDIAILVFLLFFINVFCLFFFSSTVSFIHLFFVRFSIGF